MYSVFRDKYATSALLAAAAVLILTGLVLVQASKASESQTGAPQPKYTENGVAGCLECHAGDDMTVVAKSAHGNLDNPHTPYAMQGCEACHGPGSFHSSRARGGVGKPPLISFRRGQEPRLVQNQACTGCHEKSMGDLRGIQWYGSLHEQRGMTCSYCHDSHLPVDRMKDRQLQKEQCSKCHSSKIETHPDFASDGIEFERLSCSTCHDVHQF